jgi:hypothetical protein
LNLSSKRTEVYSAALLLLGAIAIFAQDAPGVKVGVRIPTFSLPDQNGSIQTLESIKGPKGAMLVFYRSADW